MLDYFQNLIANCAVEWRAIPGYEGHYEASSAGQIRSASKMQIAKDGRKPRWQIGKILRPHIRTTGHAYQAVGLSLKGKIATTTVHAAVALAFHGPRPSLDGAEMFIDHINGNVGDNRAVNLRYCTPCQNSAKKLATAQPFYGVFKVKGGWKSILIYNKVRYYLGVFNDRDEALAVRIAKEKEVMGVFAPIRGAP